MADIKRTCGRCLQDQTPKGKGLSAVQSSRGYTLGLFCDECAGEVRALVDRLAVHYGAVIVGGNYQVSPWGTPHVGCVQDLLDAITEKE